MGKEIIKVLILILLCIPLLSLVQAQEDTARACEAWNITHSIRFNGAPISSISCNITVLNPNNLLIVSYQTMNYSSTSGTASYTLNASQTCELGVYNYDVTCFANGENKTQSFFFEVTTSGKQFTIEESILWIFVLLLSVGLFAFCVWGAVNIPSENPRNEYGEIVGVNYYKHIRYFLVIFAYFIVVWLSYVSWNITLAYLQLYSVSRFFWAVHRITYVGMYAIFPVYLTITFVVWLKQKNLEKLLSRGITVRDDE